MDIKQIRAGEIEDLIGADLSGANLRGADLRGADLRGADLTEANLEEANLRGANLRRAYLTEAYLRGANLRGNILDEVDDIFTFQFRKHFAFAHKSEAYEEGVLIQIGYVSMSPSDWIEKGGETGEKYNYTNEEIGAYLEWIKLVIRCFNDQYIEVNNHEKKK